MASTLIPTGSGASTVIAFMARRRMTGSAVGLPCGSLCAQSVERGADSARGERGLGTAPENAPNVAGTIIIGETADARRKRKGPTEM